MEWTNSNCNTANNSQTNVKFPYTFYKTRCLLQKNSKDTELLRKVKRPVLALFPSLTHSWKRTNPHILVRIWAYNRIRRHFTFTFVNEQRLTPSKKQTGNYFETTKFKISLFLSETGRILSHKALKLDGRLQSSVPMVLCPWGHTEWKDRPGSLLSVAP